MRRGLAAGATALLLAIVAACSNSGGATDPPPPTNGAVTSTAAPTTTALPGPESAAFTFVHAAEDTDEVLIDISFPVLGYPDASQAASINEKIRQTIDELTADFTRAASTAPEGDSRSTLILQAAPELINDRVFSVSGTSFKHVRGSTPSSKRVAWIFSIDSGEQLTAADLFIGGDLDPLVTAARTHLISDVLGDIAAITVPDGLLASPENYDAVWLTATGVGVGFDENQVAGGDVGTPMVLIPYTELRAVLDTTSILAPLQNGSTLPELNEVAALAAPLPSPIVATYGRQLSGDAIFFDADRDTAMMALVFNTVLIGDAKWRRGDTSVVEVVRDAGMSAIIYIDWKSKWLRGEDIGPWIDEIIAAVKANPGMISGIGVADELNFASGGETLLTPDQMIGYLEATAGRFHAELPGVPIFADIINLQLSCGLAEQASCDLSKRACGESCKYLSNDVMVRLYRTGLLDGFFLNYQNASFRSDVGETAIVRARELLPEPFMVLSRTATLSFSEQTYPGTEADAERQVEAWWRAPLRSGADGALLWVWRKTDPQGTLRTFLDKGGTGNVLWSTFIEASEATRSDSASTTSP